MSEAVAKAEQGKRVLLVSEFLSDWPELVQATVNHRVHYNRPAFRIAFRGRGMIQLTSPRSIKQGGIRGLAFDAAVVPAGLLDEEGWAEVNTSLAASK